MTRAEGLTTDAAEGVRVDDRTLPTDKPLGVIRAIAVAHRTTWRQPIFYVLTVLALEVLVVALALPLIHLLYRLVLLETGLGSVAYDKFAQVVRNPLADLTLLLVGVIAVVVVLAGLCTLFILADHHQHAAGSASFRQVLRQLVAIGRKLLHPQILLLVVYLLLILPVAHFGLSATLTKNIGVPPFVAEELAKTPSGNALYIGFLVVIFYLNLRLIFTLPLLSTTSATVWRSMVASWRLTRWRSVRVFGLVALISIPATLVSLALALVTLAPTFATDAGAPAWSPLAAAAGLAVWQVGSFIITALLTVMTVQGLVALLRDWLPRLPPHTWTDDGYGDVTPTSMSTRRRRWLWAVAAGVAIVALVVGTVVNTGTMTALARTTPTEVLAHRGWVAGGVENTLPALTAAKKSGAGRVEFDVQETKDGKFVVIHDPNLQRLAGLNRDVKDLTQAELMDITVRADGMEAKIPSLEQWIQLSIQLNLPQLLEVKIHGGESPNMLNNLLTVLDREQVTNFYTYHSLSRETVTQLKTLRPELVVGFIVPISFGGIPKVNCDFLVMEEASYSEELLHQGWRAGHNVLVWTVDQQDKMRIYMEDGVDGIISDQPQLGIQEAAIIAADKGLSGRLLDRIFRGLGA